MKTAKQESGQESLPALRRRMNKACAALMNANDAMKQACDTMEIVLDSGGDRTPMQIHQAEHRVRTAGMKVMNLTTEYLLALRTLSHSLGGG